jgi:hypothetical protein
MDPSSANLPSPAITFPAFLSVIMLFQSSNADPDKLKCKDKFASDSVSSES